MVNQHTFNLCPSNELEMVNDAFDSCVNMLQYCERFQEIVEIVERGDGEGCGCGVGGDRARSQEMHVVGVYVLLYTYL